MLKHRAIWKTAVIVCLIACGLAFVGCSAIFSPPAREIQDRYYSNLATMQAAADRIVTGRFVQRRFEQIIDPDTGILEQELFYNTFVVTESFKGSAEVGDDLHVAFPTTLFFRGVGGLVNGNEYLLFIKGRARDRQFPTQYGGTVWTLNGEPSIAEVNGEIATFWVRSDFGAFGTERVTMLELDILR